MKKRVFIAIDIPKEARREIIKIQDSLPEFNGKKTESENLHLTLKFLGEVDSNDVEKVKEKLRKIKVKGFEGEINKLGVFDNTYNDAIIIWLHLTNCEKLQQDIDNSLSDLFAPEKRFMSHLTIARVKSVKDKNMFLNEIEKIKFDKIRFKVKNFKLKQSILTRNGSVYEDLEVYDLTSK